MTSVATTRPAAAGARAADAGPVGVGGGTVRSEVIEEFRRHTGSQLGGLFGGAAFDQVALPAVAAAVDRTGRFAENFSDRGVRSGLSAMLAMWGDPADRAAEAEWLKERHKDVRGRGAGAYSDIRYSALQPENWKWIAVSGMMLSLNTFRPCTGIRMTSDEREAAYQLVREAFADLELSGAAGKLPATVAEADAYYEDMVETRLASTPFLVEQFDGLTKLPMPTLGVSRSARRVLEPIWPAVRPVVGHLIVVCSSKVMHPRVQEMTGFRLRRRHDVEFALVCAMLQTSWRLLPDRVLLLPLARNRLEYEKLVRLHRKYALDTFAVPDGRSGCPM
ncbi:oxygenase MpaB family protein [Gordonia sp. 'Campus']|uniref:oxygenase MpaB family protein n=1 Tax=Gordonia sp. 'Campus' TaxID=2915824 RepID=UPI001EE40B25|nr:oxygenase MpaB family protein [Gordonia sp. 'Campus']